MARKTRNCKKRGGRRGIGINARTVRVQRHLENIQRDISTAIAELGQLSANIQQRDQNIVRHNQNRNQNRNAPEPGIRNHQNRNALERRIQEPGHRNRVLNNENRNAPGRLPNNRNVYPNDGYARDWVFQGVRYARMGNDIWEIDPYNRGVGSWVGVYLPAENRINRNALEPEYENE